MQLAMGARAARRARQLHLAHGHRRLHRRRGAADHRRAAPQLLRHPGRGRRRLLRERCARSSRTLGDIDPWITATGVVTLVVALVAQADAAARPVHDRRDDRGQRCSRALLARAGFASVPTVGALPSGAAAAVAAVVRSRDVWRKLVPAALALTVLGLTEAVSIARAIALQLRPAHRRQPGVHRPGTVEHRRRVLLGVSVVGLVQPQRRQLRSRRAHAARGGRSRRSSLVVDPVRRRAARPRTCRSR